MRYLIANLVPSPDDAIIEQYREKYRTAETKITLAPHITLAPPIETKLPEQEATAYFQSLQPPLSDFRVEVDGVNAFLHNDSSSVWAAPRPSRELTLLHNFAMQVYQQICQPFTEMRQFTPHITIVKRLSPPAADTIKAELAGKNIRFDYLCDRIHLLKKADHDDFWQQIGELKLS